MATIGVLALQGDVREHAAALERLGATVRSIKGPDALRGLDGIVLPGGESTTMSLLLRSSGLEAPLREAIDNGLAVFGTCAGLVLLAADILDGKPDQLHFDAIDLSVRRNGYGPQLASFEADLEIHALGDVAPLRAVFIRAPIIDAVGEGVEVLASLADVHGGSGAVLARQGRILVCAFHPELTGDDRIHKYFLEEVATR